MDSNITEYDKIISLEMNDKQTSITPELLHALPKEVENNLIDYINTVPYIKSLIAPNRPLAKDLPRDEDGKIIIDLTKPHLLENMDYFRPSALHYLQYGNYTELKPNANPNSAYGKWIRQELDRCWNGMIRKSDGEWITGPMYFFLNYSVMEVTKTKKGSKQGYRIQSFPEVWEGIYYRFHYLYQARYGGIYNDFKGGNHCAELASRGKGKSYSLSSLLAHNFVLGEAEEAKTNIMSAVVADNKEYLSSKDGTLSKFINIIDFCAEHTQFPRRRILNSIASMTWKMGYKDAELNIDKGTQNTVIGVTINDDIKKIRGKRMSLIGIEEYGSFPKLIDLYAVMKPSVQEGDYVFGMIYMVGCVCAGTKVWTLDGRNINIEQLKKEDGIIGYSELPVVRDNYIFYNDGITRESIGKVIQPAKKECLEITLSNGNSLKCSIDHPILKQFKHTKRLGSYKETNKRRTLFKEQFVRADSLKINDRICECRTINIFGNEQLFDARLVGMLIGDGSYGFNETPKYSSEDEELLTYIKEKYSTSLSNTHITKKLKIYEDIRIKDICSKLKEIGIYGQTKLKKRLPLNYQKLDEQNIKELLSGLYDTDGCYYFKDKNSSITITQSNKSILEEIQILWRKFGVICSIKETKPTLNSNRLDKNPWFTLTITGAINLQKACKVLIPLVFHKKESKNNIEKFFNNYNPNKVKGYNSNYLVYKIVSIKSIGEQVVYNLSACTSRTYLANNIITHNTAGDKDSDFYGAREIMYNPKGYNIYNIPNIYDKININKKDFIYFFPGYLNRKGCYDENGNSDVIKALIEILLERYNIKYHSTDPNTLLKNIAEVPITPSEAILKANGNLFPTTDITERIGQLDANPSEFDDVYVGDLVFKDDKIIYTPTNDNSIREFPHKDNKINGAIEIFEMPKIDRDNKVFRGRYIAGLDPVDDDTSETMSLLSIFVLDLWTDKIVCEWTGRLSYVDDGYERIRKICLFYNAVLNYENNKKGIFAYFSKMNCLYLLAPTLEFLKDKDMIKSSSYINNKSFGVNASASINNYARHLLREWLIKPVVTTSRNEQGELITTTKPLLYTIRNRALLKELLLFNSEGNFDRISAMGMLMLYREDRIVTLKDNLQNNKVPDNYLGNDKFFTQNYNNYQNRYKKYYKKVNNNDNYSLT